jgi:hypothetical protein
VSRKGDRLLRDGNECESRLPPLYSHRRGGERVKASSSQKTRILRQRGVYTIRRRRQYKGSKGRGSDSMEVEDKDRPVPQLGVFREGAITSEHLQQITYFKRQRSFRRPAIWLTLAFKMKRWSAPTTTITRRRLDKRDLPSPRGSSQRAGALAGRSINVQFNATLARKGHMTVGLDLIQTTSKGWVTSSSSSGTP